VALPRRSADLLVLLLIAAGLVVAWTVLGHTQDDAFITFRYSKNWVGGHGPVFNPGDPVEGYTNFLWMALMTIPIGLGLDPVTPSWIMGLACLALNLWLVYRLASRELRCHRRGFAVFLLVLSLDVMLAFGTSGMETALNGLLVTGLLWWVLREMHPDRARNDLPAALAIGTLAALCLLSRPDNLLIIAILIGFLFIHQLRNKALKIIESTALISSFLLPVLSWMLWKVSFYGELLPNTFFVKTGSIHLWEGSVYVGLFVLGFGLVVPAVLTLLRWRRIMEKFRAAQWMLLVLVLAWTAYLIFIGGDFMNFRMWIPVIPAIYLLTGHYLFRVEGVSGLRYGVLALLLLFNLLHLPSFGHWYYSGFALPITRWTVPAEQSLSMSEQGKALQDAFGNAVPPLKIAVGASGALPYYSDLETLDIFGLSNREIARHGVLTGYGPGHRKVASLNDMREQGVHLWVYRCDHRDQLPDLKTVIAADPYFSLETRDEAVNAEWMWWVQIPVGDEFVLSCWYANGHPLIDLRAQSGDYQMLRLASPN
jgi:arabinofuranosyltransferase